MVRVLSNAKALNEGIKLNEKNGEVTHYCLFYKTKQNIN